MKKVSKWINHEFQSSSQTTEEWKKFARDFRSDMNAALKAAGYSLVSFSRGHFSCSLFAEKDGKHIYISLADVRMGSLNERLLVRSASGPKDYSGGRNNYLSIHSLSQENLDRIALGR